MTFQNRVDPFGVIHAVPLRGMFTGNRGIIHNPDTRTLMKRRWSSRAWIICDCGYKNRKRDVMGANGPGGTPGWTNLFFLDEVTGLAAGHRPCFACRRRAATDFAGFFADAAGIANPRAAEIDAVLHRERRAAGAAPAPISRDELLLLPEGAMVARAGTAFAVRSGRLLEWSFAGYRDAGSLIHPTSIGLTLLTPAATVSVLRHGYCPVWHESAARQWPPAQGN
jgi:hypothetical protein